MTGPLTTVGEVAIDVQNLMDGLGLLDGLEHTQETPNRIARFYMEWLVDPKSEPQNITAFEDATDQMIVQGDIVFHSLCAHHMLPFFGMATVGYIPNGKIVGLSKLARVVDHYAHQLQVQERLGEQIADFLMKTLDAKGVGVILTAEHLCMAMRGVTKPGAVTTTSVLRGVFLDPTNNARNEFLSFRRT